MGDLVTINLWIIGICVAVMIYLRKDRDSTIGLIAGVIFWMALLTLPESIWYDGAGGY